MKTMKLNWLLGFILLIVSSSCEVEENHLLKSAKVNGAANLLGQGKQMIYAYPDGLGSTAENYVRANTDWSVVCRLLTGAGIESSTDSTKADLNKVTTWINNRIPVTSTDFITIDWEGAALKRLRSQDPAIYVPQAQEYVKVVNKIKELRPKVKVCVYGLLFQHYYSNQADYNLPAGKFDPIFQAVDFITPTLYLAYPDDWKTSDPLWNENFLRTCLSESIQEGVKHNKPVVPFFWHRVHTNSTVPEAGYVWSPNRFAYYVNVLLTHTVNGVRAGGLIMWDSQSESSRVNANSPGLDDWIVDPTTALQYDNMMISLFQAVEAKRAIQEVNLTFSAGIATTVADKNGVGTGFTLVDAYTGTRLPEDGSPTNAATPEYEAAKLTISNGRLQLVTNKGISSSTNNNQINALGVQVNSQRKMQVNTTLINPYYGTQFQQGGLWFGLGDKTFVKLVVAGNQVELRRELNDVSPGTGATVQRITSVISGLNNQTVRLRLVIDPVTRTAEAFYSTDGVTYVNVGAAYTSPALDISDMGLITNSAYAGIFASHRNGASPVTYNFDDFKVAF